jgi:hypothetical protein
MRDDYKKLAESYGWKFVEDNKNKYMDSYMYDNFRINYYFTSGTLMLQGLRMLHPIVVKDSTVEDLENLILQSKTL